MKTPLRIINALGSWWLTASLFLALWSAYLAFSFGRNPYPAWIEFLFNSSVGVAVYIGLIANLIAASIRIGFARFRRPALTEAYIRSCDSHYALPAGDENAVREAAAVIGIPAALVSDPERGVHFVTGRWSFLPGMLFRAGLALTLISLLIVNRTRATEDVSMHEGDRKPILGANVSLESISAKLPADYLQVGDEGTLLLEGVSAGIDVDGKKAKITPGFPTRINGRWYRIRHLGYSQAMTVDLRGARSSLTADLDILPPGRHSIVSLPSGRLFFTFSLDPDRTITKGLLTGKQYNLANPAYRVIAQEGKPRESPAGKRLKPGERTAVGPAQMALGDQRLSIRLQVISDPGLLPLYIGVVLALSGLCTLLGRFFWYEREVALLVHDGKILIGARDEFFKKWGVERFQKSTDSLAPRNLA